MANTKISQWTEQTLSNMAAAGTSDLLGGINTTSGSQNRKFSLATIANFILSKFKPSALSGIGDGSTIGAISSLNSKTVKNDAMILNNANDLNDFKGTGYAGMYYLQAGVNNAPSDWCWMLVINGSGTVQICCSQNGMWIRAYTGYPMTWTNWVKSPTRSEFGSTSLSGIGDGSVTGAISALNARVTALENQ